MAKCEEQVDGPICLPLPGLSQTHSAIGSRGGHVKSHCEMITCLNGGILALFDLEDPVNYVFKRFF